LRESVDSIPGLRPARGSYASNKPGAVQRSGFDPRAPNGCLICVLVCLADRIVGGADPREPIVDLDARWVIAGPSGAAATLGVKRTSLQYKMRKL
jgi:hypothetical protein